jgi:hypothetical protein
MTSKTIKGRVLSLHLAQHVKESEEIDEQDNPLSALFYIDRQILHVYEYPWYKDLVYYLQNQRCTDNLDTQQRRRICIEYSRYVILGDFLFRRSVDGILLCCVNNKEAQKLLQETHGSLDSVIHVGGHFSAKITAFEITRKGYYWPSIFRDYYNFSRYFDKCQKFVGKERLSVVPLQPVLPDFPFSEWGLDFIDPVNPLSSTGKVFILTTTEYFTKCTEVVPLKHSQDEQVISFLEINIFSKFGLPLEIITDNGPAFISVKMTQFIAKLGVKHFTPLAYYPQGNGHVESTNKNLVRIIKRLIEYKPRQWHNLLTYAL